MSISARSSMLGRSLHPLNKSTIDQIIASRRVSSVVHSQSKYRQGNIPTVNLKFEQLCKIVFGSMMSKDEAKQELIAFV